MYSRSTPQQLDAAVRDQLALELADLRKVSRPRGRRGQRHDRLIAYLAAMIEHTSVCDTASVAGAGDRVSIRFFGDVEHRTYRLVGDDTQTPGEEARGGMDCPALPVTWPLGAAVVGLKAGDRFDYLRPDGTAQQAQLLAVWDGWDSWQLPAQESPDGAAGDGGPDPAARSEPSGAA